MKLSEIQSDILQLKFSLSPIVTCDVNYILELLYFIEKTLKDKSMKKKKHSYTFKQMAIAISKEEGKKHELTIAQISEVLKIVADLVKADVEFLKVLLK